jgi:hypothetical protein
MLHGRDAVRNLFFLAFALTTSFGCTNAPQRQPMARAQAGSVAPPSTRNADAKQPATPLRAPGDATPVQPVLHVTTPQAPAGTQPPDGTTLGPSLSADAPPPSADNAAQLRRIQRTAAERYAGIDSYIARLRRREQVNGKDKPEETLLFKFRKQPFSVYFKWLGPEAVGREVTYVKGQYEGKLHTLLAAGDMPLAPAGKRIALAPDNVLVRGSSRHSITEAGMGNLIDRFGDLINAQEHGDRRFGTATFIGQRTRPEFATPQEEVEQTIPAGSDPALEHGGRRFWFFDSVSGLPQLLITLDGRGHEVEYYCYDRVQYPVKLDNDDFNPDKLWKPKN